MYGAEYTPGEFARSVCSPGAYVGLTSFTHHPFYTRFALEVPDNTEHNEFYNVPIDTLMATIERAVRTGHGVCWEGDNAFPPPTTIACPSSDWPATPMADAFT